MQPPPYTPDEGPIGHQHLLTVADQWTREDLQRRETFQAERESESTRLHQRHRQIEEEYQQAIRLIDAREDGENITLAKLRQRLLTPYSLWTWITGNSNISEPVINAQ
jgi:hypothetical protein